jgi:PAS domain S-box-containing protein
MDDNAPLYNSRIAKTYVEYLRKNRRDLDIDALLSHAGISKHEVEDPAHWFTQSQVDRFQDVLIKKTGNPDIAREAGRYSTSYEGVGPAKQYVLSLMNLTSVYLFLEKSYSLMSRAAAIKTKKLGSNKVEITSAPNPGVAEKAYQCKNRIGFFESLAKLFTNQFAKIEHPLCYHRGDDVCRYIISWKQTPAFIWKRFRNLSLPFGMIFSVACFFIFPLMTWVNAILFCAFFISILSLYAEHVEKKELAKTIDTQGNAAKDLIDEMNIRHDNALLAQEIGQAASATLDIEKLLGAVMIVIKKRLKFDRGLIMLTNEEEKRLCYKAGYGYTKEQERFVKNAEFSLDNPTSKGVFVLSYKQQKPFLVNDINEEGKDFSKRSLAFARKMGAHSFICVPIVYENESLGVLSVDNINTKKSHTQSDINLLMGVASQTAISINNVRSFQKLQENEEKYRDLVQNANSIIMRGDISGNITFFNEFAQKYFGYAEEEILCKNVIGTILPETEPTQRDLSRLINVLQKDPELQITSENRGVLRNGKSVWIAWAYKPILDKEGNVQEVLCIGNDITDLKCAEQEKKDLETKLQHAEKMEALGTLAGGVAHDLNNILAGVVGYPELLLMRLPDTNPLRESIKKIKKSGQKAAAIVQDLLTMARRGVAVTEVISLNDIISEYLKSPENEKLRLFNPRVLIETNLENNLLNIFGSPVHLSKVIMNLVSNASEAMPDGGRIYISTENKYVGGSATRHYGGISEGDYVQISVSDAGVGMTPEDKKRIFEPFYTKKVMGRSGTGLGMAVVWATVKDHNGYIDIESSRGKGTKITLLFPATRETISVSKPELSIEKYMGKGEFILIVDDVDEQRRIMARMLRELGYSVRSVPCGEKAVDYVKSNAVDLLILDMIMDPGIDGLETYNRIIKVHPGQKAIITSGFSETKRVKKALSLGVGAYVRKPFSLEQIGTAIRSELDR